MAYLRDTATIPDPSVPGGDSTLAGVQKVSTAVDDLHTYLNETDAKIAPASETVSGIVELATDAEAEAHTLANKAVTPANLLDIYTKLQGILTDKWLFDRLGFLNDEVNKLISGETQGTEGRWKCTFVGETGAITTLDYYPVGEYSAGPFTRLKWADSGFPAFGGSLDYIKYHDSLLFFVFGDSGTGYRCFSSSEDRLMTYPKHGDVTADFTIGNTYPVFVFEESSDPADQQTGYLDVVEYFLGNNKTDTASVNAITGGVGSYATLNAGYWDGPNWQSQLLGDLEAWVSQPAVFEIKMSRPVYDKVDAEPYAQILDAGGVWVDMSVMKNSSAWSNDQTHPVFTSRTPGQYFDSGNTAWVNIGACYATLGYTSVADLLANSAVKVEYKTKARGVRPIENPTNVLVFPFECHINSSYLQSYGVSLAYEIAGFVGTNEQFDVNSQFPIVTQTRRDPGLRRLIPNGAGRFISYSRDFINYWSSTTPNGVIYSYGLYESGGTLHVAIWSKELVYDSTAGNWGDDGKIPLVDHVTTTTDDNGNVVIVGTYGWDTGHPVPGAV